MRWQPCLCVPLCVPVLHMYTQPLHYPTLLQHNSARIMGRCDFASRRMLEVKALPLLITVWVTMPEPRQPQGLVAGG
jgi:hypothetical protein